MRLFIYFITLYLLCFSANATTLEHDQTFIKKAENIINLTLNSKYEKAHYEASISNNKTLQDLVKWIRYQRGESGVDYPTIMEFVETHKEWPRLELIKNFAEYSLGDHIPPKDIIKYFSKKDPQTPYGKYLLLKAKISLNKNKEDINKLLKETWVEYDFTPQSEQEFLNKYGAKLTQKDYIERIDRLLWDNKTAAATRLFNKIDDSHRLAFNARILMSRDSPSSAQALKQVPERLINMPGLLYERVMWHKRRKNYDYALFYLVKAGNDTNHRKEWWEVRNLLIRELIQIQSYKNAYILANTANNEKGSVEYADSEWLAGWIATEFLNRPQDGYKHFYNMFQNVKSSISSSRASYWAAKAAEKNGNTQIAQDWYKIALSQPTTFYGQLAHSKIMPGSKPVIPAFPVPGEKDLKAFKESSVVNAIIILIETENYILAEAFIKSAMEKIDSLPLMALISEIGLHTKKKYLSVVASKEALRKGVVLTKTGYPVIANIAQTEVGNDLVLGIIRQESNFDPSARSAANAIGLMQVLPGTAHNIARNLGLRYNNNLLIYDPAFNIKIGGAYINRLYKNLGDSYLLAIASYNAGPANVSKWVKLNKDPRKMTNIDDIINWIELIPFAETRNYVQRVLENKNIYHFLLYEDAHSITDDLKPKKIAFQSDNLHK